MRSIQMTDKVNEHLTQSMHGAPNLKPDEQRKYLGHFRERVIFTMTPQQMIQKELKKACQTEIEKRPNALLLINGKIDAMLQTEYMSLSSQLSCQMTIVTDNQMTNKDAESPFGIVYVDDKAIDRDPIDIAYIHNPRLSHPKTDKPKENKLPKKEKKKSFFNRIFG